MKKKHLFIIFVTALLFRILVVLFLNTHEMYQDAREYYQLAANLVNGNGYSFDTEAPYEITLYREPGYPLFLASLLKIRQLLICVHPLSHNQFFSYLDDQTIFSLSEITYLKIGQAIIDAISVLFFVLIASFVVNSKKLLLYYGLAFAIFLPAAFFITNLMRETWLTFLCSGFAYFFVRYLLKSQMKDLFLFSLFFGMMALTFQVMLLFGPAIIIYFFIYKKPFEAIKSSFVASTFAILLSLPWLLFSYNQYPDVRIIKSWGTSLTKEKIDYVNAHRKLQIIGTISQDSLTSIYWNEFGNSAQDAFRKSFEGYYTQQTAQINLNLADLQSSELKNELRTRRNEKIIGYAEAWFRPFSLKGILESEFMGLKGTIFARFLNMFFFMIAIGTGIIAFTGFISNVRKLSSILIVFYTIFPLIYLLDSGRRIQPIYGYLLLFFILQVNSIYSFLKER